MDQQGTDTNFTWKPVQRYVRPEDTLDLHCRTRKYGLGRNNNASSMPPPLNYMGIKKFRTHPHLAEEKRCVPAGLSGVYRYTGPVMEGYGIEPKFQIPNTV